MDLKEGSGKCRSVLWTLMCWLTCMQCGLCQERTLGEEERKDLERQAASVQEQIAAGSADADALRRAAAAYRALGESGKAADTLQKLVEKEPSDSTAWQLLVRNFPPASYRIFSCGGRMSCSGCMSGPCVGVILSC